MFSLAHDRRTGAGTYNTTAVLHTETSAAAEPPSILEQMKQASSTPHDSTIRYKKTNITPRFTPQRVLTNCLQTKKVLVPGNWYKVRQRSLASLAGSLPSRPRDRVSKQGKPHKSAPPTIVILHPAA